MVRLNALAVTATALFVTGMTCRLFWLLCILGSRPRSNRVPSMALGAVYALFFSSGRHVSNPSKGPEAAPRCLCACAHHGEQIEALIL
jgi:hypothetical protein